MLINYFLLFSVFLFLLGIFYKFIRFISVGSKNRFEITSSDYNIIEKNALLIFFDEFLFLKTFWETNRKRWYAAYGFHISINLIFLNFTLSLLTNYIFGLSNTEIIMKYIPVLTSFILIISVIASILGIFSTVFLLFDKKNNSINERIKSGFKNSFFLLFYLSLIGWLISDKNFVTNFISIIFYLDTFTKIPGFNLFASLHIILIGFLFLILPFGLNPHFIFYFIKSNKIKIDDFNSLNSNNIYEILSTKLDRKIKWINPHINLKGEKTWIGTFEKESL